MLMKRVLAAFFLLSLIPSQLLSQTSPFQLAVDGGQERILWETRQGVQTLYETGGQILDLRDRSLPGSTTFGLTWSEYDQQKGLLHFAMASPDGQRISRARRADYTLLLRYRQFDPLVEQPTVPPELDTAQTTSLWIVQFWTQYLDVYGQTLASLGVERRLFLAHMANVVSMDPALVGVVKLLPFVRAVVPYQAAYKLSPLLLPALRNPDSGQTLRSVNILSMRRGPAGQDPVAARILTLGGSLDAVSPETYLMQATLTPDMIAELARMDEVQWIDPAGPPEEDMDIARAFHGANAVENVGGYTGNGVRAEVLDGGCDATHPDLQNHAIHGTNTPSSHGTSTSGIVCGSGAGNFQARGAMPAGFLIIADYAGLVGSRFNHTSQLQDPNLSWQAVLQSNSWGNARTTAYTSISQDMDLILFDNSRINIFQSQSNSGNQMSRPQAWAKNIISVGGVRHHNTLSASDDNWGNGASIGPAEDGSIKPDLSSFYDSILTTDRVGSAGFSSTNYYASFGGTSGATPIVAGMVGLLYQMWSDGIFSNPTPGSTVFDNRPFNTTMKALVINTATQWAFSGTGHDLTRVHQGWGHPDLQRAYDLRNQMFIVDESDVLLNLGSTIHNLTVNVGTPALKATLVYRDNPGTTSSTQHRINDLDLKVTSPSGTVYFGNNGLLANMWSTPGGSPDTLDTVENVFIQNPAAGVWQVEVIASELNQDNHVETPALDADYALVVSGVNATGGATLQANFSGTPTSGSAPLSVTFSDLSTGNVASWSWSFGDGTTSTLQNPSHTYTNPGAYDVSLTVTGPAGSDVLLRSAYVTVDPPAPVAQFSGTPTSGGAPLQVSFTNLSTGVITTTTWVFGDGSTSLLQNPTHTYLNPGTYTVILAVVGPGGFDSEVKSGYIQVGNTPPVADFSANVTSGSAPLQVDFTDLSTGVVTSWSWDFGDGSLSSQQNPTHIYTTPGSFDVTLSVSGPGGSNVLVRQAYINVSQTAPVAAFSADVLSGPAPLTVHFTDQSSGTVTSWLWIFGDGATSTLQNPVHTYLQPGVFNVTLGVVGPGGLGNHVEPGFITATERPFYVSFDVPVVLPGAGAVETADIVHFDPVTQSWSLFFDGSDMGLSGADLNACHVFPNGDVLLSFAASSLSIPGLIGGPNGNLITSNDLVYFAATSTGPNTAGSFIFAFDGSDVGLVDPDKGIDGIDVVLGAYLVLSLDGNTTLFPFGVVAGQDMLLFAPTAFGAATTGSLIFVFSGNTAGLQGPGADLDALTLDQLGRTLFSTSGSYSAGGVLGDNEDISRYSGTYGPASSGSFELIHDLSLLGIVAGVDALSLE